MERTHRTGQDKGRTGPVYGLCFWMWPLNASHSGCMSQSRLVVKCIAFPGSMIWKGVSVQFSTEIIKCCPSGWSSLLNERPFTRKDESLPRVCRWKGTNCMNLHTNSLTLTSIFMYWSIILCLSVFFFLKKAIILYNKQAKNIKEMLHLELPYVYGGCN